ncbi:MAG TPA: recombinase family protein [Bryobacteraceae bacterium]|nr:recombinase family protein [Bryobacteraceae bacterium]
MTKAFAYLRVSGKGQVAGDGFPRQLAAIDVYCKTNGVAVARVYREKGVSGTLDGMDRPAWVEMVGCILANGVKTIIIEKLDRLARDLMIQEHILEDLRRRGITLISVAEPDLCSDDPSRKLMRQIMGAIAEYDRRMVVLKLRGARQRMRTRDGRCEGAKPYGARAGELETLRRIQARRAAGDSFQAIAAALNADNVAPRRGVRWHPYAVARIASRTGA